MFTLRCHKYICICKSIVAAETTVKNNNDVTGRSLGPRDNNIIMSHTDDALVHAACGFVKESFRWSPMCGGRVRGLSVPRVQIVYSE